MCIFSTADWRFLLLRFGVLWSLVIQSDESEKMMKKIWCSKKKWDFSGFTATETSSFLLLFFYLGIAFINSVSYCKNFHLQTCNKCFLENERAFPPREGARALLARFLFKNGCGAFINTLDHVRSLQLKKVSKYVEECCCI